MAGWICSTRRLSRIEADIDERPAAQTIIVFLGDLIDRGPASAEVVERLRTYRRDGVRTVFLSGNHEEVLLRLIRGESRFLRDWLTFGGAECARSYRDQLDARSSGWTRARRLPSFARRSPTVTAISPGLRRHVSDRLLPVRPRRYPAGRPAVRADPVGPALDPGAVSRE